MKVNFILSYYIKDLNNEVFLFIFYENIFYDLFNLV